MRATTNNKLTNDAKRERGERTVSLIKKVGSKEGRKEEE
jgi:hypothetical protein